MEVLALLVHVLHGMKISLTEADKKIVRDSPFYGVLFEHPE